MFTDILAIIGFIYFGFTLPDLLQILVRGGYKIPLELNILTMLASGFICASIVLSV